MVRKTDVRYLKSSCNLFGEASLLIEDGCRFAADGLWGLFEIVGYFEDAWGAGGERGYVSGYGLPVDLACAGPEVVVFLAVVVVEVELGYAGLEEFEGGVYACVVFGVREVGVAYVEADAYAVEVAYAEDFEEVPRGGDFVLKVFEEDADA